MIVVKNLKFKMGGGLLFKQHHTPNGKEENI
nr:MAG TPA: hypothetical protein [Caudoviricetes sp.]